MASDFGCIFCGRDPYEYVDVGVGYVPVAVSCCDHGIGLYQYGQKPLVRIASLLSGKPRCKRRGLRLLAKYEAQIEGAAQ